MMFDSVRDAIAPGARSESATERQLLYSVSGFDIDVRLRPRVRSNEFTLVGQILPAGAGFLEPTRLSVYLVGDGGIASLAVTRFGEFMAFRVPPGEQTVELVVDDRICYQFTFVA